MRDKIDELFDTERLRASWNGKTQASVEKKELKHPTQETTSIPFLFDHLCDLIKKKYPGEKGKALNVILSELNYLLMQRFANMEKSISTKEKSDLNQAIDKKLCEIEDLIDAIEISR